MPWRVQLRVSRSRLHRSPSAIAPGVPSGSSGTHPGRGIPHRAALLYGGPGCSQQETSELDGQLINFRSKGALGFQHPVRLYLPKSKSQKFLNNIGEKVLASFPVQATIHFYNDDADSEEDEEEINSA
ncbi:protein ripply3 [Limosa lapponica baueri]|uniref:Protein ripply3 n=1 Tax=Limosa lapponica baueri TaxID=1758121 RepID=A0A2I0U1M6_LIMLA|nr:protein ripply3 [Limosa lapponica baueri]